MIHKHTPGPWKYFPYKGYAFFIHSEGNPLAHRIATLSYTDGAHTVHEADARLIATAPELLATLESMVAAYRDDSCTDNDDQPSMVRGALAAIAKARGEPA